MNTNFRILLLVTFSVLLSACVTKKKKGDVSWMGKKYQNITAKYNGYFNAKELYDESYTALEYQHQPNYNQILDLYPAEAADNPKAVASELDKVIEKVSTVGSLREQSQWLDDCYVLMGQAQFLKQDYEAAEETLEYFVEEFDPGNPSSQYYQARKDKNASAKAKKRAKEEERKEKQDKIKEERNEKKKEKEEADKKKKEERKLKEKEKKEKAKQREEERKRKKKEREEAQKKRKKSKKRGGKKKRPAKKTEETKEVKTEEKVEEVESVLEDEVKEEIKEEETVVEEEIVEEEVSTYEIPKNYLPNEQGGLFKHTSVYSQGMLWLAKTYIARQKFSDAEFLLRKLSNYEGVANNVLEEIAMVQAESFIKQKKYDDALPLLEQAIKNGSRDEKARLNFVAAQIYEQKGNTAKALASYKEAKKHSRAHEMSFNTDLSIAKASLNADGASTDKILGKLNKMKSEKKNEKYLDQLFFTSGQIKLNSGDEEGALEDFEKAIEAGTSNSAQKTEIYYSLGEMFYKKGDFVKAKDNYDLATQSMDKKDPRYNDLKELSDNLRTVVRNIEIVETQDSLLRIASYDEKKLNDWARMMLEREQIAAESRKSNDPRLTKKGNEAKALPNGSKTLGVASRGFGGSRNQSKFFAYNPSMVEKGIRDFGRKWGDRPLVDNWRRTEAIDNSIAIDETINENEDPEKIKDTDIEKILRQVPLSEKQKEFAKSKIEKALHMSGTLLRTNLKEYQSSADKLTRLEREFPSTEFMMDAYYYLFLDHADLSNISKSNSYKDKLLSTYPDSKYSMSIKNPNYFKELEATKEGVVYEDLYQMYNAGQYQAVLTSINENQSSIDKDLKMKAKYDLLRAMSIGGVEGKDVYIKELNDVIARNPNSKEQTRAKEIIRFLKGDVEAFDSRIYEEDLEKFYTEDEKLHFIMVVLYDANEDVTNQSKINISEYNNDFHKTDRLKITNIILNIEAKSQVILIRRFPNKEKVMDYVDGIKKNKENFLNEEEVAFEVFAITQHNYREVMKQKSVKEYRFFFQENYE